MRFLRDHKAQQTKKQITVTVNATYCRMYNINKRTIFSEFISDDGYLVLVPKEVVKKKGG